MQKRVADIITETLVERGITDCFAVVGGGAMQIDNALAINKSINKVFCHHEQACAMAAESYAKALGRPALVSVTAGPGSLNTFNGIQGAWVDNVPVIVIAGYPRYETTVAPTGLKLRCRGVQEFDAVSAVAGFTKYAKLVTNPLSIRKEVNKCVDLAMSGRRGPVWLSIPLDVQGAVIDADELEEDEKEVCEDIAPDTEVIDKLNNMIADAKRPCILTGSGIRASGSTEEFRKWAARLNMPIVGGALVADACYEGMENYYGMSGNVGPRKGNFILQNADLIIILGNSMAAKQTGFSLQLFAPNAKRVMVDIEKGEMEKPGLNIDLKICSELKMFFEMSATVLKPWETKKEWRDYCDGIDEILGDIDCVKAEDDERIPYSLLAEAVLKKAESDAVFTLGNSNGMLGFLQKGVRTPKQRTIVNYNCGSMGDDLPEAIGASVAFKNKRPVYCITGDGSVMMNLQELQTIQHYGVPVKLIIMSNDGYGALRQTFKNFFNGTNVGCDKESGVSFPDFVKVAEAFNMKAFTAENVGELEKAVDSFVGTKGSALLLVKQKYDDPVSPKVMSKMKEDGTFSTPALHEMFPFLEEGEMEKLILK